jgi:hypothetical protein
MIEASTIAYLVAAAVALATLGGLAGGFGLLWVFRREPARHARRMRELAEARADLDAASAHLCVRQTLDSLARRRP